ncbi:MAG: sugar phosphate isomerase/epimerase [Bryobacteraceae bacterium]|nr:sugar phosphate isomerase/epimerase [Bryobacteraceae bacterium]MDW8379585.1 sugar phosphate isomerase/epimerase family protein [Bryobacterales bacterium]
MSVALRHAICNEIFQGTDFAESCRMIKKVGYQGIEIAPFTLSEDPVTIDPARRREIRNVIQGEGLEFVGLHWLLVAPKGLHVTTPDDALRARSWMYIQRLVDLCADLGPNGVMVFGSPLQRSTTGGSTREEATRRFVEGLAGVAPHAAAQGVTILVEALPVEQSDVVQSLAEAVEIVREIGSPAIQTMFDTHNAVHELEPHATLVDRYYEWIRHVHVNERDGKHCGQGDYDFKPLLAVLMRRGYRGWVSLEAFDFSFGGERIATESLRYLEAEIAKIRL